VVISSHASLWDEPTCLKVADTASQACEMETKVGHRMQKTILIVDFEQESCEELQQALTGEDYLVLTAADGDQALAVFQAVKPDLVLTEALLPKLNGFELCKKITTGVLDDVRPVIMYSAIYKGEKYQKEAISVCGALEFLEKPIPKWQLLKTVRSALEEGLRVKRDATANLPNQAGIDPRNLRGTTPSTNDDGPAVAASEHAVGPAAERVPPVELKPSLTPSMESKEIDAALDAVRVDLHHEAQQLDELLAQRFEQELQQKGQSILEFEASVVGNSTTTSAKQVESGHGEFELDEVLPQISVPHPADAASVAGESTGTPPTFAIKPTSSRNWFPVLVLILLALLAAAYFWLQK